jgi:hypothetical protein
MLLQDADRDGKVTGKGNVIASVEKDVGQIIGIDGLDEVLVVIKHQVDGVIIAHVICRYVNSCIGVIDWVVVVI